MKRRIYKQRIVWNAITVEVVFDPDWLGAPPSDHGDRVAHLQLRSLKPENAPLPVTETGYRSHFLPTATVIDAGGPIVFARHWLNAEADTKRWKDQLEATRQYAMF